jgi:hypothetical protein
VALVRQDRWDIWIGRIFLQSGSGPEDEHPLDQVGDLPDLPAVHSGRFLPPGKQVVRRLFAEDITEPLDRRTGRQGRVDSGEESAMISHA